ncbi:MAG: L-seryl-tRNA(Sec) selenium transferase [Armatimonadota bacterium]|nr:L-seryl-tRNA(Sec) selenium transferase [Armatimonadota bacterium]MDR7450260.1 L-seryl-tRNA(Sec) selenium transferase [Armatimonadota bacterium]MDR7467157.1 L-seryl-tRNA(Sec) selenium transferase [Armatimonadota bacterium]MDR7493301.1 L-seryl-tRNA(Sec) selenium transferase [Armatimonadota bacterium]MDR7500150.1 L-seryl-tRNA(Sec) selenium transferase [Armatimonadota bacterium]
MGAADLRHLPAVERLVQRLEAAGTGLPRTLLADAARAVIERTRAELRRGEAPPPALEELADRALREARTRAALTLTRAVNATGIILHTNLGRAPLPARAVEAVAEAAAGYSTLEVDLDTGRRGSRHRHVEPLLTELTGAAAAVAVNNNAGAVLLALAALARDREVIVSRGELVEIGGSFRLPDVMAQSGARLVEVGTTNRTYPRDYERAITPQTALLLKVHRSNFRMDGFVCEVSAADLVEIGRRHGLPVMYDLGSGCLVDLRRRGLPPEPTVREAVEAGCDVVAFSGDKLLGGPQAGLLVGSAAAIEQIRAHPLARALRMDKLDYAALSATLQLYRDPETAWTEIPVLQMLSRSADELRHAAEHLQAALRACLPPTWRIGIEETTAEVGGGSLPEAHLPSVAVVLVPPGDLAGVERALRRHRPPVFARIAHDAVLLDVRTLLSGDERAICDALCATT